MIVHHTKVGGILSPGIDLILILPSDVWRIGGCVHPELSWGAAAELSGVNTQKNEQ